jgi:hypothetical protein
MKTRRAEGRPWPDWICGRRAEFERLPDLGCAADNGAGRT